ncbi:MAG: hypothetical protein Q7S06_02550 [Nanoarchaeota archaeon]|nr:hypothetical protein [Nanoarchaeota archaeon]
MIKNPIYIPKSFRATDKYGEKTRYTSEVINGKMVRIIEYRNKEGLLHLVNIWGICKGRGVEELKELEDCYVAYDENIDSKTHREMKEPAERMYPKPIVVAFF